MFLNYLISDNTETTRPEATTSNTFDALKMVEKDDELGANGGTSKTADNVINPNVDTRSLGTNREKVGSNIGKNKESVLADMESESDVDEVYNETQVLWHLRAEVELE